MTSIKKYANIYLVVGILSAFVIFSLITLYYMSENINNRTSVHIKNKKLKAMNKK